MKNPSVPRSAHDPQSIGPSCTGAFVPAIEIGCFLKSQCPCMMVHAETSLLIFDGLSKFKVNSACGSGRSHWFLGKDGSVQALMLIKCAFTAWIALSAGLVRWSVGEAS